MSVMEWRKVDDGLLGWDVWKRKEDGRKSVGIGIGWRVG